MRLLCLVEDMFTFYQPTYDKDSTVIAKSTVVVVAAAWLSLSNMHFLEAISMIVMNNA